jgi:hypothetical protein
LIRLLAVDIDGTLTGQDRKLHLGAVEALRAVEEHGIPVSLASGNILQYVEAAATMIGLSGPIIAEDGGVVYDPKSGEFRVLGSRSEIDRALKVLGERLGSIRETRSSRLRLAGATLERSVGVERVEEVLKSEGFRLVAVDSGFAIHLRAPEVNKGRALRVAAEMRGVALEETAAIADGPNDVELLRAAGYSFAVGNAPKIVKRAAKRVLSGKNGDGVVEAAKIILELSGKV